MLMEHNENVGQDGDVKDGTDSVIDFFSGLATNLENQTFPRRSVSSSLVKRKIDFKQLLEQATEEDKQSNVYITHPSYEHFYENTAPTDENIINHSPINLSATNSKTVRENSALDLSSLKNRYCPQILKDVRTFPNYEHAQNLQKTTPLKEIHLEQQKSNQQNSNVGLKGSIHRHSIAVNAYERVVTVEQYGQAAVPPKKTLLASNRPELWQEQARSSQQYIPSGLQSSDNYKQYINNGIQDRYSSEQNPQNTAPRQQESINTFAVPELPPKLKLNIKEIVVNGRHYQILALLGKGGSSKVYLVLAKDNSLLAIKRVNLSNVDEKTKMDHLNEIEHLMKMQDCKHIIKIIDHQYVPSRNLLYAVMERGDTDLSRLLKERTNSGEGVPPEMISFYWSEILLAVKSIHDNNIIHRDLKPANFLLVAGRLKLIDFGIASAIQSEQTSVFKDSQSGTPNYMSPEAWEDLGVGNERIVKIGRKTDVWSLGCILYSFLYGKTPFQEYTNHLAKFRAITNAKHVIPFPPVKGVPELLIESCRRCLIFDKNKRASIDELIHLKNQILMTPVEVLKKLSTVLDEESYSKAAEVLSENSSAT